MLISIIIPVRNEQNYIQSCIESVLAFQIPVGYKVEILILDGMSEDKTVAILQEKFSKESITIIPNPGQIRSTALNKGIRLAKGEYMMLLDAHAIYPVTYLKELIETSNRVTAANIGGVILTLPGGENYGAQVVQAITTHKFGVGNSGFRVGFKEGYCDTVPYGFYRREIFENIGFFDERLTRSQDYEFNRRLARAGGKIWQNPGIIINYYNQKFFFGFIRKQFFLEGPGNARMWYLAPYTITPRHLMTSLFSGALIAGGMLSLFFPAVLYIWFTGLFLYFSIACVAAVAQASYYRNYWHILTLPVGFFLFHVSHGLGTLTGLLHGFSVKTNKK